MFNMHEETKIKNIKLSVPKAIIIAGALVALSIITSQIFFDRNVGIQQATDKIVESGNGVELLNKVDDSKDFIRGAKRPKVTIVEFSDFGCGFCASFHPTLRNLVEAYPNDVAWVYRHLPYRNNEAALASECVGQTFGDEAFWKYSDVLFAEFPDITNELLVSEALKLGFANEEEFQECKDSESVRTSVEEDAAEARLIGASGTPHSIVMSNDQSFALRGATPEQQLEQIIKLLINK